MFGGVFGASSTTNKKQNPDGSWNVHCYSCGQFISVTFERFQRALCMICQYSEEGKPIPEETLMTYMAAKASRVDVSTLLVPEVVDLKPLGVKRKFNLTELGGDIFRAIAGKVGPNAEKEKEKLPSVAIAKAKRRPRLFDGALSDDIVSMDEKLKGEKK
jgi:hypothetical protein